MRFSPKLLRALQRCENNREMVSRVGVHFALEQCHDLLDNDVAGIFCTLNRSDATRTIFDALGIPANAIKKPRSLRTFRRSKLPGKSLRWLNEIPALPGGSNVEGRYVSPVVSTKSDARRDIIEGTKYGTSLWRDLIKPRQILFETYQPT